MPFVSFPKKPKHSSSHRALLKGEGPISNSKIRTTVRTREVACSLSLGLAAWITFMSHRESQGSRLTCPFPMLGLRTILSYKLLQMSRFLKLARMILQSLTVLSHMTPVPMIRVEKALASPWDITTHLIWPLKVRLVLYLFHDSINRLLI